METYSHAFYTWALAKHGVKAGRAAGIAGAVGASFPDLPAFAATVYYVGPAFVKDGWAAMDETMLENIYFSGPFGATGSALHSAVPVAALLALYFLLKFGTRDRRSILLWFLIGWFGHTLADFLTHVDDVRPLFWPLSDWTWSSPVSYYDHLFFAANHALMLLVIAGLILRRRQTRPDAG